MDLQKIAQPDWSWFEEARFGMFLHWGLYSQPARHEWVQSREKIAPEEYRKYFEHFDPDLYDPHEWAAWAVEAGMRYAVLTTKHHDGFCLWDSAQTDYKATNTPCGRDLLQPWIEAFRKAGLRIGLYHSVIDWHHPEFNIKDERTHPMREDADFVKQAEDRDMGRYADYLHAQVRELLTDYGQIDYLFFDFSNSGPQQNRRGWRSEELVAMCRELQPNVIINDRLDLGDVPGGWDVLTPEQFMVRQWPERNGKRVHWETCQTFSGSWGYHRDEQTWKSVKQLLTLLIDSVGKGGNVLLNVGPTARGTFDERTCERLADMGEWMRLNGRSIYGCTAAPEQWQAPQDCRLTYHPETRRLYIHCFNWPLGQLHFDDAAGKVAYAQLLHDASEVQVHDNERLMHSHLGEKPREGSVTFGLPIVQPDVEVPVIEVFLKDA